MKKKIDTNRVTQILFTITGLLYLVNYIISKDAINIVFSCLFLSVALRKEKELRKQKDKCE